MAKMARERALQEKRELKRQKKEARKLAKAEGRDPDAVVGEGGEFAEAGEELPQAGEDAPVEPTQD
jgi:hypothetical protein